MQVLAPVLVRNTEPGPVVLSSNPKGEDYVEWQGAGDPTGADVQPVPETFLKNVNFLRAVQRGILVIENPEDNPEIAEAIEKQNAAWAKRREDAQTKARETLDHTPDNDMVSVACVGPACTQMLPVKSKQRQEKPPLCSTHEKLAPQYVRTDNVEGDETVTKWERVTVTARERSA
jgi:hypothetical protein